MTADIAATEQEANEYKEWQDATAKEVITHILNKFHDRHRQQLPQLIGFAKKVERQHAQHPHVPKGLANRLQLLQDELNIHMMKEERVLFPMLERDLGYMADGPIAHMETEHVQHVDELNAIRAMTKGLSLPEDACATWKALYEGLREFSNELMEHIRMENMVLFSRFSSSLEDAQGEGMLHSNEG